MSRSPFVDPIEERLSNPSHLDGSEFTQAVLRRLPARRARLRGWILTAGAALSAGAAALLLAGPAGALGPALVATLRGSMPEGPGALALLALVGFGLTAAIAAAAELGADRQPGAA